MAVQKPCDFCNNPCWRLSDFFKNKVNVCSHRTPHLVKQCPRKQPHLMWCPLTLFVNVVQSECHLAWIESLWNEVSFWWAEPLDCIIIFDFSQSALLCLKDGSEVFCFFIFTWNGTGVSAKHLWPFFTEKVRQVIFFNGDGAETVISDHIPQRSCFTCWVIPHPGVVEKRKSLKSVRRNFPHNTECRAVSLNGRWISIPL